MLRITNFNVVFNDQRPLELLLCEKLGLPEGAIRDVAIVRKAIDARRYKHNPIYYVYTLDFSLKKGPKEASLLKKHKNIKLLAAKGPQEMPILPKKKVAVQPVVVGTGPAGLFCALTLCKAGYEPLIFERGQDMDSRHKSVADFWQTGCLRPESNVQFGEGGAGTFSDGKLTTRINDPQIDAVLETFVRCGAPQEIRYLHKPHIGTDLLRQVIKNLRQMIIDLGGKVHFNARLDKICRLGDALTEITLHDGQKIPCRDLFLGIGHSARDTYEMLFQEGVQMEAKPFAVGVRIEHPQELIDRSQYGEDFKSPYLPVADYALTFNDREKNFASYSFCMCPGGKVVAAASENECVVTNGMSDYARDFGIANSALLVPVTPDDFGNGVLDGIKMQRHYEHLAFLLGGRNYCAPAQTVGDFLSHRYGSDDFLVTPSYCPGITLADLHFCLPKKVSEALEAALLHFDRKIPGFADKGAVMTGVEMRSSAPCRINRDKQTMMSVNTKGLYPIGEGAGYAGGIVSAAVDGINAAHRFIEKNKS